MNVNFDTLEYIEELIKVGIEPLHAEAITKATAKAISQANNDIASKKDLFELKVELIQSINYNTWKIIGLIAGIQSIVLGAFGLIQYIVR